VLLSIFVTVVVAVSGYLLVFKTRLVPIFRARFENRPYADFDGTEPTAAAHGPATAAGLDRKSDNATVSIVLQNEANARAEGPST
jgi:hypothetical protein